MMLRDLYQDVLGSAGLSVPVLYRVFKSASLTRVAVFLKNFVVNGRIVNAIFRYRNLDMFVPKSIVIEPTFKCNSKCPDCYASNSEDIMDTQLFSSIIRQSKKVGVYRFVLMGGEPTLPEVLDSILPVIKENSDCVFTFCTNCTQINEHTLNRFSQINNVVFLLSMEGTKKATDKRRGEGTYDKYLSSVQTLRENKFPFAVSITIDPQIWETQISDEVIADYYKSGGTVIYSYSLFDKEKQQYLEVPRVEYLKKIQDHLKNYHLYWGDGRFGKMKSHRGIIPRDNSQVCIDPNGNVRGNRFFYNPVFGNLKDSSLKSLLALEELIKFKRHSKSKANSILDQQKSSLEEQGFQVFKYDWRM